MSKQELPERTIERKKREAEALKANMRRRKVQAKINRTKEQEEQKL